MTSRKVNSCLGLQLRDYTIYKYLKQNKMKRKYLTPITLMSVLLFAVITLLIAQEPRPEWDIPDTYKTKENPHKGDESLKMIGLQNYNRHCKSCHGKTGKGDGVMAQNINTFPGDFTTEKFKGYTDGEIYYMSFIGREEMPNFEKKITSEEDRWAVVNHVRVLGN